MIATSASTARTSGLATSPTAVIATPTKIEKTTICKISLVAIASTIDAGTICVMNLARLNASVDTPASAPTGGNGRLMPTPGWIALTRTRPRPSDSRLAQTNQPIAFAPTRPKAAVSPICAMPLTSVANTSGAIIILMSRRKIVVPIEI